jgi:hypothetical protein
MKMISMSEKRFTRLTPITYWLLDTHRRRSRSTGRQCANRRHGRGPQTLRESLEKLREIHNTTFSNLFDFI